MGGTLSRSERWSFQRMRNRRRDIPSPWGSRSSLKTCSGRSGFGYRSDSPTIGFAVATNAWVSFAMLFSAGAFDAISVVLRISLVQIRTPDALRGRVAAVNALFISSSNQWGAVESGVAADLMGTVPSVVFGGVMTIVVVVLIGYFSRSLWKWRN